MERGYSCNKTASTEGRGFESAGYPSHGKRMDSFHAFDVFDNSSSAWRIPQSGSVLQYWKDAGLISERALLGADAMQGVAQHATGSNRTETFVSVVLYVI